MRLYTDPVEALRETERDLWEMGIDVCPQTMQDKNIAGNKDYMTKELQAYGFHISFGSEKIDKAKNTFRIVKYLYGKDMEEANNIIKYVESEFYDRIDDRPSNPGNSYKKRLDIWNEFLHDGKFAYTYSERMAPQIKSITNELRIHPDTRQAIINIHSNICPLTAAAGGSDQRTTATVLPSMDLSYMGGHGRIPCSMYYQIINRRNKVDLIYTMRSCDFLTHFAIDLSLALLMQQYFASLLNKSCGMFTYFTGSLHAYYKDMKVRGIF